MKPREMMGFDIPGDARVPVPVRDWNAMKIAVWRMKTAFKITSKEAEATLGQCVHSEECPGADSETEPCLATCPDREVRMSALVILNAARRFSEVNAPRPADEPFFAPSREYYSEVLSDLAAVVTELEGLYAYLRARGIEIEFPIPGPVPDPPQLSEETAQ